METRPIDPKETAGDPEPTTETTRASPAFERRRAVVTEMKIRIRMKGEGPGEVAALAAFLQSKRGRKLLKRVAGTDPGRDLIRALKKEPGGRKALRALFSEEMPKTKRKRAEQARSATPRSGRNGKW